MDFKNVVLKISALHRCWSPEPVEGLTSNTNCQVNSKFHRLQIIDYSLYKSAVGENTNLGVLAIGRPTTAEKHQPRRVAYRKTNKGGNRTIRIYSSASIAANPML